MKHKQLHYVLCVSAAGAEGDLILRKAYQVIPDAEAEADGLLRIIDESGEDYLYPAENFVRLELPAKAERALQKAA